MLRQYRLRDYNFILIILLASVCTFGILLVGSADSSLQMRQLLGAAAGFVIMIIIGFVDYSWILNFYWGIYIINLLLLFAVYMSGITSHGAARWIQIGGDNGIIFQPVELSKILLILFFSMYFMKNRKNMNSFRIIAKSLILVLIPLFFIFEQPDLKNTITIAIVFFIMIFAAGLSYKLIGKILLIIVPMAIIILYLITQTDLQIIDDYQKNRILTFLDPENDEFSDEVIQQNNSITAIGSGQLTGKGLNNSEVTSSNKGNFVAEIDTDFIFAVAGEELGFVGCFCIITILFLIVFMCLITGQKAKDTAGCVICCGMGSLIAVQSFINICVATGLFPNTGTPLPFVSYGLTSLVSLFIGMGFVINVGLQRKRNVRTFVYNQSTMKY